MKINETIKEENSLDFQSLSADGVDMGTWAVRSSWLRPVQAALAVSSVQVPWASKTLVKLTYGLPSVLTMSVRCIRDA